MSETTQDRIAVVGGGAWGTALGALYARAGHAVRLFARDFRTVDTINRTHENPGYLPGLMLPENLAASSDPARVLEEATLVLLVVPAQSLRMVLGTIGPMIPAGAPVVLCAKGIERETGRFASDIAADALPCCDLGVLSGPSFAADVARGLPTAVTVAAADEPFADRLAARLSTDTFRCYASADPLGVEAGGALKNVLALAAGAAAGRNLGESAKAAIVTRGFVELRRLGAALGGKPQTLMGLSGLGDLILTCSGPQSRNFAYGLAMGRGDDLSNLKLAEGVFSAEIASKLARDNGIETPIIDAVAAILAGTISVDDAMHRLLSRPLKRELDD